LEWPSGRRRQRFPLQQVAAGADRAAFGNHLVEDAASPNADHPSHRPTVLGHLDSLAGTCPADQGARILL
jgi:hypothetical protein